MDSVRKKAQECEDDDEMIRHLFIRYILLSFYIHFPSFYFFILMYVFQWWLCGKCARVHYSHSPQGLSCLVRIFTPGGETNESTSSILHFFIL